MKKITQQQTILVAVVCLYIYFLAKRMDLDFDASRAWFLGAYSALTVVYSVQPQKIYEQAILQILGTGCMLVDMRWVYAYFAYPMYIFTCLLTVFYAVKLGS